MIAPPQRLPFVVWRNSRLIPLSENWLVESIDAAAGKVGYAEWELSHHIARAIAIYLEEEFNRQTINLDQLQEMMAQSIDKIGFPDVAQVTSIISPRVSISLSDLAKRSSFELFFFPLLNQKIEDALGYEASGLIFEEIRLCVKILHQAKRWKENCDDLRILIIEHIRTALVHYRLQNVNLVIV